MHLPWDDLRVFLAAWEQGTLTAAAAALGVGQATASRRIASLEDAVGQRLFDRHRSGLLPTDAARALHGPVLRMAEQARLAQAALAGLAAEPEGVVRVAVPPGVAADVLPPLVPGLRARHPRVRLEILGDNFSRDLTRHEADLAFRSTRPTTGDLVCRRMPAVPIGAWCSPAYAAALPDSAAAADLDWLQWSAELAHIPQALYVDRLLAGRAPALTSNSFVCLRASCQQGLGCMVLPAIQAQPMGLIPVPVALPQLPAAPFYLVVPRSLRSVPRVAAVVDYFTEVIEQTAREQGWAP